MDALHIALDVQTTKELLILRRDKVFREWFEIKYMDPQFPLTLDAGYEHFTQCGPMTAVLVNKLKYVFDISDEDTRVARTQEVLHNLQRICEAHGLPVPTWTPGDATGGFYDFDERGMIEYAPPYDLLRHLGFWGNHGYEEEGQDENGVFHPCRWVERVLNTDGITPMQIYNAFCEWNKNEVAIDDEDLGRISPLSPHAKLA